MSRENRTRCLSVVAVIAIASVIPDVVAARPDGILFDAFNDRVYVFSHPTKSAVVIDSKDGNVLGTIDLGGVPEQAVADGKGKLWAVMQDAHGSVTAVDAKTMQVTG